MEHAEFPSSEVLAAFIDGQLDEATRNEVTAHVADCDECYATLDAVQAWRKNEAPPAAVEHPQFGGQRWIAVLGVAAAVAIAVFITPEAKDRYAIHELKKAASVRPTRGADELPLTGIAYRPAAKPNRGGGNEDTAPVDVAVLAAAADVEDRATARDTPRNQHALALAHLISAGKGDVDAAFAKLSDLIGSGPDALARCSDVTLVSDFGAAAYAKHDYQLALKAYRRALQIDSNYAPAQFGLAKTLGSLARAATNAAVKAESVAQSKDAWHRYLQLDSTSEWANDARAALKEQE